MKKNVTGQHVSCQLVNIADGLPFTGTARVAITVDNGTQDITPSGTLTHKGRGCHNYATTTAETNGNHIKYTFDDSGGLAIPVTIQVYTTFPQSVDNNVLAAGSTGFAETNTVVNIVGGICSAIVEDTGATLPAQISTLDSDVAADIAAVKAETALIVEDTGTTLPATLSTAQTDLDTITGTNGVFVDDGAITAAKIAANAITAAKIATDAITAAKIAPDAIGASELAADAVTEIADGIFMRDSSNYETAPKRSLGGVVFIGTHSTRSGSTISAKKADNSEFASYTITVDMGFGPVASIA